LSFICQETPLDSLARIGPNARLWGVVADLRMNTEPLFPM